jgi:uncharacterized protein YneF (UPF0154 family)
MMIYSAIVILVIVGGIVWGGFIGTMIVAMRFESKKLKKGDK